MNATFEKALHPDTCVQLLHAFWRDQAQAKRIRNGIALTLPLMYPDGWQVDLRLEPLTPGWVRVSDAGRTLGTLIEAGMSLEARQTAALLDERIRMFELKSDGAIISKELRLPLQGIDLHVFAEALVSISHLIYRHEPNTAIDNPADKVIRRLFEARKIVARRHAELPGRLVKATRVDYLVDGSQPLAVQVVSRRENLLDYMERWAFRWDDLKKENRRLIAGMIYNPEIQEWDDTSLRIGEEVCDIFCRYDEVKPLNRALDRIGA